MAHARLRASVRGLGQTGVGRVGEDLAERLGLAQSRLAGAQRGRHVLQSGIGRGAVGLADRRILDLADAIRDARRRGVPANGVSAAQFDVLGRAENAAEGGAVRTLARFC